MNIASSCCYRSFLCIMQWHRKVQLAREHMPSNTSISTSIFSSSMICRSFLIAIIHLTLDISQRVFFWAWNDNETNATCHKKRSSKHRFGIEMKKGCVEMSAVMLTNRVISDSHYLLGTHIEILPSPMTKERHTEHYQSCHRIGPLREPYGFWGGSWFISVSHVFKLNSNLGHVNLEMNWHTNEARLAVWI